MDSGIKIPKLNKLSSGAPNPSAGSGIAPRGANPAKDSNVNFTVNDLLKLLVQKEASDLHIAVASPPVLRIDGKLVRTKLPALNQNDVRQLLYQVMTNEQRNEFERELEIDFAYSLPNIARFRVNIYMERQGAAAAFRTIPSKIKTLVDLNMPTALSKFCDMQNGLVLLTGPTGSGKSTTIAAIVDNINKNQTKHIITVEDPIEFVHEHKGCLINQREIKSNTKSFAKALKSALREDPDVILVGEMRDLETISAALTAAETGHLVFATLHTNSAAKSIDRIIDVFPSHQQEQVRVQLSETLRGVVTQTLIPKKGMPGRVCACEILFTNHAISNLIRENKTYQIISILQTSKGQGMQSMDQTLQELLKRSIISAEDAYIRANDKKSFQQYLKGPTRKLAF